MTVTASLEVMNQTKSALPSPAVIYSREHNQWEEDMNQLISSNALTMTSQEISELVQSRHDSVKRAIERLAESGTIQLPPMVGVRNHLGQAVSVYQVGKRDSYVVVAQLSPEFTAALVDRWQELEAKALPDFTNPVIAARAWADAMEQNQQQAALLEQQRPAVEFLDRYVEAKSTKSLREVAKVLGVKEREFIAKLEADGILFRQSRSLLPMAQYQHKGYFEVKTGESNGHAYHQTRFTPAGLSWIAGRFVEVVA